MSKASYGFTWSLGTSLTHPCTEHFYQDKYDNLWISTCGGSVFRLYPWTEDFRHIVSVSINVFRLLLNYDIIKSQGRVLTVKSETDEWLEYWIFLPFEQKSITM